VIYNSKAMLEHSIATLLEGRDEKAAAREAYGRALQEDLAFYPAHVRIGLLALGERDTTAALTELELATQVAVDDPYVRYTYAYALASTQQVDKAMEELTKAVTMEPLYALPHALLGRLWEQKHDAAKAAASYEAFLARASRRDPQRAEVTERLADVKSYIKPQE
jgi:tetratricopeptide (TPR) repeat protein